MFCAKVTWDSGREVSRLLGDTVDSTAPELVKYIPQNYLETICSELKEASETGFDRELMEVIFSHVSDAGRLGKETLPDLIEYLTNEKEARISQLTAEITKVNGAIVALEDQLTDEYQKSIEAQLSQRCAELTRWGRQAGSPERSGPPNLLTTGRLRFPIRIELSQASI